MAIHSEHSYIWPWLFVFLVPFRSVPLWQCDWALRHTA